MHSVAQGQACLETLPEPDNTSLEPCKYTALMYKKYLASLNLCCDCDSDSFQTQLDTERYVTKLTSLKTYSISSF